MLILLLEATEKRNEVLIGENILLRVLDVYKDTGQVRIGIEAPKEMIIDRRPVREMRERRIKAVLEKHDL